MNNILNLKNRYEFREWLKNNHDKEKECYLVLKRGKPTLDNVFYYLDAVEEALSFGWIDSTVKKVDGIAYQRFSKRLKNSRFSELNKERCRRLIKLGLMDESGLENIKDLDKDIELTDELKNILIENNCLENFLNFPKLYQRIRIYNLLFYKDLDEVQYKKALDNFIKNTKLNKMYGEWNDYNRLLNY